MDNWRAKIAERLLDLFQWIGIDPITGFAILITPVVILRLVRKGKKEKMLWETMYDISFVVGSIVIYVLFLFHIFGFNLL